MALNRLNFGALEEREPLTKVEKKRFRERFEEVGRRHFEKFTLSGDLTVKADFKQLFSDFWGFVGFILKKIDGRESLSTDEEKKWKQKISESFLKGKCLLEQKEQRLFEDYMREERSQDEQAFIQSLFDQYQQLKKSVKR